MKNIKKIILTILLLVMLSGCSINITRVDNDSYEQILDKVIALNIKTYNKIGSGYKYYAPRGVIRTNSLDYNDILTKDDRVYYLYVDVVGYYYKTKDEYYYDRTAYFSKKLSNGDKKGYIEINKKDGKLYVKIIYNYAKIETYVEESKLKDAILDMSYIVSSIDFNDSLLTKLYESGNLSSKDEVYKLFKDKEREGNFLDYIKEYDKYDESQNENEEVIITQPATTTTTTVTTTKKQEEENNTTEAKTEEKETTTTKQ